MTAFLVTGVCYARDRECRDCVVQPAESSIVPVVPRVPRIGGRPVEVPVWRDEDAARKGKQPRDD